MTAAVLAFDAAAHEYRTPEGVLVPSVTHILQAVGISVDFDALAGMSHRIGQAIDLKRDIGTALHADAHALDDNDLEWSTVDPRVEPYLRAWATFRENSGVVPITRERRVWHRGLGYCGTLDGIFRAPNGKTVLIDIKTGDCDAAGTQFQTAAYAAAYAFEHPDEPAIEERWGVQLVPDRRVPYRIFPYTDWTDFGKFQAFVTTFWCQAERRPKGSR